MDSFEMLYCTREVEHLKIRQKLVYRFVFQQASRFEIHDQTFLMSVA